MIGSNKLNHLLLNVVNLFVKLLCIEEHKMYLFNNKPIQKRYHKRISQYED